MAERAIGGRNRRPGPRRRGIAIAVGAAVFGLALVTAILVATNLADKPTAPSPTEAVGRITGVQGSTITMSSSGVAEPPVRVTTVMVSPSTRFTLHAAGAVSDVRRGDNVLVMGPITESVLVARQVVDGGTTFEDNQRGLRSTPPPPTEGPPGIPSGVSGWDGTPPVAGIVDSVDGSSFTLSQPDGSMVTVDAHASEVTVLRVSSLDELRVGEVIRVVGMSGPNQSIAASSVHSRPG